MTEKIKTTSLLVLACGVTLGTGCSKSLRSAVQSQLQGPGLMAMAVEHPQPEPPIVSAPNGMSNVTFYRVAIQGINVGSAVIARSSTEAQQDVEFELKFSHRLGYAPLLSQIKFSAHSENGILTSAKQNVAVRHLGSEILTDETEWKKDTEDALKVVRGNPESHLMRLGMRPNRSPAKVTRVALPFFDSAKKTASSELGMLNPLSGLPLAVKDITVKFAADGVADELTLPFYAGLTAQLVRQTESEIEKLSIQMPQNPLELSWFSIPSTIQDDLRALQSIAVSGAQFSRISEKLVRKDFPQLPYLFHRKLFNFNKLCERLSFEINAGVSRRLSAEQVLLQIAWVVRNTLAEDHRELPRALVNSPELEVLADDEKKWQWVKIIAYMLDQTREELGQVLSIEDAQKVNVSVRVSPRSLARGSVVKGMVRSGRLAMRHQVESAGKEPLNSSSLLRLPANLMQPLKVAINQAAQTAPGLQATAGQVNVPAFEFINGQSFAKGDFPTLSPLCETYRGRVGIDLGNSRNDLFSSTIVRGVWDESTRVQLIRQFARRASANPNCRDIVVRTPEELTNAAKNELDSFRRDILQTEMEFQISVGSNRTVRLVPGSYDLVISSLVNGSILGKREIIIPQGHENLVLNLQL